MPRRILIIDDEPHVSESLKDRLESMGYEVIVAHDGRTALALITLEAKPGPIGGVLLDVQMPVMDGTEVLRELRARHPDIPVVMMTAGADRKVLLSTLRMGASEYLLKPFNTALLSKICEKVFPLGEQANDRRPP